MNCLSMNKCILCLIYGICFAEGVVYYMGIDSAIAGRTVVLPLIFIAGYTSLKTFLKNEYKCRLPLLIYSLLFSGALIVGKAVFEENTIKSALLPLENALKSVVGVIGIGVAIYMALIVVFDFCLKNSCQDEEQCLKEDNAKSYVRFGLCVYLVIIFAWLLAYLAFFPGVFSYDIRAQTVEAATHVYARANPPLHTMFWSLCLSIYNFTGIEAIVIYSIVQMIVLAFACTDLIVVMWRKYHNKFLLVVSILFFISPAVAIISFATTKDVLFAAFFMLMYSLFLKNDSKKKTICMVIYGVLACLLRNNAIYALFLTVMVILLIKERVLPQKKSLLVAFVSVLIIYLFLDKVIYSMLGVGPGWPKEKLSVMIQQITCVRVYEEDTLTDEQRIKIEQYLPAESVEKYNPRFADAVKDYFNEENYVADSGGFWKVWLEVGMTHPSNYINAFLNLNLPYWYIDSPSVDPYSQRKFIETRVYGNEYYDFERNSILPGYYERLMKTADYSEAAQSPLVGLLLSIGLPIWLVLASIAYAIERKRMDLVVYLLPAFFFWLTYMAGPVSNFRYIFPLYILYPFYIAVMLFERNNCNETEVCNNDKAEA